LTLPSSENALGLASSELRRSLHNYLRGRLPDATVAEDLLQDILVKALVADRSGQRINNLVGWLHAAARTTVADYYRSRGERMQELDESVPENEIEDFRLHAELSKCLMSFAQLLQPKYRDTLLATDIHGKTMRSLADEQQVSVSAIKSRASRARALLREKVLACCAVEVTDGIVSEYRPTSSCGCGKRPGQKQARRIGITARGGRAL